jgi:acyl carrier protein
LTETEQIRKIIGEHARLEVEIATLSEDDSLYAAGLTSHASVNLMLALEDAFDIEFPENMLRRETFESVSAIRTAVATVAADVSQTS